MAIRRGERDCKRQNRLRKVRTSMKGSRGIPFTLRLASMVACVVSVLASPAAAQDAVRRLDALQSLNSSVESLVEHVSKSVVQVLVTSYGPVEAGSRSDTDLVIGRQRSMGSGVVID